MQYFLALMGQGRCAPTCTYPVNPSLILEKIPQCLLRTLSVSVHEVADSFKGCLQYSSKGDMSVIQLSNLLHTVFRLEIKITLLSLVWDLKYISNRVPIEGPADDFKVWKLNLY